VLLKYVGITIVIRQRPRHLKYMRRLDLPVEFVDGLRVSRAETVEVAKWSGRQSQQGHRAAAQPPWPAVIRAAVMAA
jgi:acetylglutamate kinase